MTTYARNVFIFYWKNSDNAKKTKTIKTNIKPKLILNQQKEKKIKIILKTTRKYLKYEY